MKKLLFVFLFIFALFADVGEEIGIPATGWGKSI